MIKLRGLIPRFLTKEIPDRYIQENFSRLNDHFLANNAMVGFEHFELSFTKAETNLKVPHNLGFKPLDVINCSIIGGGGLVWNYDQFDEKNLNVTTTGACTVRAYIGTHIRGTV